MDEDELHDLVGNAMQELNLHLMGVAPGDVTHDDLRVNWVVFLKKDLANRYGVTPGAISAWVNDPERLPAMNVADASGKLLGWTSTMVAAFELSHPDLVARMRSARGE